MNDGVESLNDQFVVNCTVRDDTENGHRKVSASNDDEERDDTGNHKSDNSRENDTAINEIDGYQPGDKSDASHSKDGADQRGHTSEHNEKETSIENGTTNLTHLPVDVLDLVIDFAEERILKNSFASGSANKYQSRPHMSLTTTNRYFYNLRRHLYWKLTKTYSLKYYEDEKFRANVHSRVENPSIQLSVDLSECSNITDVSALGGVHTLNLSWCSKITDVSALGGVHTLDLRGCSNITDVSALGGVHTLDLTYCSKITDVSALKYVPYYKGPNRF